jgi:hypothetical protein
MVTNEVMNAVAEYLIQYVFTEGPNKDSKKTLVLTDKHDCWGQATYEDALQTFEEYYSIKPGEEFTLEKLKVRLGEPWLGVWLKKNYPFLNEDMLCVTYGDNVPEIVAEILDSLEDNLRGPELFTDTWT